MLCISMTGDSDIDIDNCDDDDDFFLLLASARDKYEAVISVYNCAYHDGLCICTKLLDARQFLPDRDDNHKLHLRCPSAMRSDRSAPPISIGRRSLRSHDNGHPPRVCIPRFFHGVQKSTHPCPFLLYLCLI